MMQKRYKKRTSLLILCMVLSMTFFITGCQKQAGGEAPEPEGKQVRHRKQGE